jgi:hypothetical protein
MNNVKKKFILTILPLVFCGFVTAGTANAGAIYLTGHDVLLHGAQNGYDDVILDYLRSDPSDTIARSDYDIGQVGYTTDAGGSPGVGGSFGSFTETTVDIFGSAAAFGTFLSSIDVLVIPWIYTLGVTNSVTLNSYSSEIETFFNAGGDIFANSSHTNATYFDFLPSGVAASGPSISGSSGFVATTAGLGIGIASNMINGFQTHNAFTSFSSAFTVFETRSGQDISIGLQGGSITDGGGIVTTAVPEPATLFLFGVSLFGILLIRKSNKAA